MSGIQGPPQDADRGLVDSREVLLVAAAIVALILAAFLVPPSTAGGGGSGGEGAATPTAVPTEQPGGDGEPGDSEPGDDEDARVRPGDGDGSDGGTVITDDGRDPHPDCFVVVWDRLVPGSDATVLAWNDGAVQRGREVWFDGRSIGETDETGRVDGRVPYSAELTVTVDAPAVQNCTFVNLGREVGFDRWDGSTPVDVSSAEAVETVTPVDGNVSATFDVVGEPELEVTGDPFPGETVQLRATVEDVPMRSATVLVNGREVGETDGNGSYELRVPDDGTETLLVEVTRGDFTARESIAVLLLDVEVRPAGFLALPGREVEAVTTLGDRDARDVTVRVAGETVGTTGLDGRASFALPSDPQATVAVEGYGQTATVAIWPLYLRTLLVVFVVLGAIVGSVVGASRRGSAGATRLVAGVWAVLGALGLAWLLGGQQGLLLALGVGGLVGLGLAAFVYRESATSLLRWTVSFLRTLVGGILATVWAVIRGIQQLAIRLADGLLSAGEWLIPRIRALLARTPHSLSALLRLARTWLAGWRGALRRLVLGGPALARTQLTAGRLAIAGHVVVAAGGGYAVADLRGALVAAAVVGALLGIGWRDAETAASADHHTGLSSEPATTAADGEEPTDEPSLRRLWRTFARWVVPGQWPSRTPGEVARRAVDRGFPREPVERLTDVFREVEYGDRSLSDERYGRARAAFRALRGTREREGEE